MNDAQSCDEELLCKLDAAASPEVSGMLNRYFVAALCESAAARLRFKDAAIDNLAAEVERLREERRWRDADKEWPAGTEWCLCLTHNPTELTCLWFDGHGNWTDANGYQQSPTHWTVRPELPPTMDTEHGP